MQENAAELSIRRQQGGFVLELKRADQPFRAGLKQVVPVDVDSTVVPGARDLIEKGVASGNAGADRAAESLQNLRAGGRALFNALFPRTDLRLAELKRAVWDTRLPLLLETDEPNILWELLHDGTEDGFLGLRFNIGRRLLTRDAPTAVPDRHESWRALIISDPNFDEPAWKLDQTAAETRRLKSWLEHRGVNCDDYLEQADASAPKVTEKLLSNEYGIIHFAGHVVRGMVNGRQQYALRLQGGELLSATTIQRHVQGYPLVFLNGCHSGQVTELHERVDGVQSLTNAFLEAGAQAVVGSLFRVPDDGGRVFAETFYATVLAGESLGEAMRKARLAVYDKPHYGPAWACFVMYGDPCLQLEFTVDEFQLMLNAIGEDLRVSRATFDADALQVLQKTFNFARRTGVVGTPHLFAAFVEVPATGVRSWLERRKVSPQELSEAFKELFEEMARAAAASEGAPERERSVGLSDNARVILRRACELAQGQPVSANLLVTAFAQKAGGRAGIILKQLGIDVRELAPARGRTDQGAESNPAEAGSVGAGCLTVENADQQTLRIIASAATPRRPDGRLAIDSLSLCQAMRLDDDGPFAQALRRMSRSLGVRLELQPAAQHSDSRTNLQAPQGRIAITESVENAFVHAAAIAADRGEPVSAHDLLKALVATGGGSIGKMLAAHGIVLEALTTRALLEDGGINRNAFDESGRGVLGPMVEFAHERRHSRLSRCHLLFGLLRYRSGEMAKRLKDRGTDADYLADLLAAEMTAAAVELPNRENLSPGLLRVLCAADAAAARDRTDITDAHLFKAFITDGGCSEFLVRNGVPPRTL